jgi:hypothetical protein
MKEGIVYDEAQRIALVGLLSQYLFAASKPRSELPLEFSVVAYDRTVDVNELLAVAMLDTHFGAGTCAKAAARVRKGKKL